MAGHSASVVKRVVLPDYAQIVSFLRGSEPGLLDFPSGFCLSSLPQGLESAASLPTQRFDVSYSLFANAAVRREFMEC